MREWKQDHTAGYERYTWLTWVVYKSDKTDEYVVYNKHRLGIDYIEFETPENAMIYAETMEAVGA